MSERKFSPGFRLSAFDLLVLSAGAAAAAALAPVDGRFGLAVAFVVAHFFLFCNVLRMSRPLGLAWAVVFAGLAVAAFRFDAIPWPLVVAISTGVTVVLAVAETRKPSYHGVGWQKLNPGLPEWWTAAAARERA